MHVGNPVLERKQKVSSLRGRALVTIGGSTHNGGSSPSEIMSAGDIGTIKIGGDVGEGTVIASDGKIGSIAVGGSIGRDTPYHVDISAQGKSNPTSQGDSVAIGKITVGGNVTKARIEAGYHGVGDPTNPDASIGSVQVGGDWIGSDLVAGIDPRGDGYFGKVGGIVDDMSVPGGNAAILAKIASISIGGQLIGTPTVNNDSHAFAAEVIGSMKLGGAAVVLPGLHDNFNFTDPSLSDVTVEEI